MPLASNDSIPLAPISATNYPTAETPVELGEDEGCIKGPPYLLNRSSSAAPTSGRSSLFSSSSAPADDAAAHSPSPAARSSSWSLTRTHVLGSGTSNNNRLLFLGNGGLRGAIPFTHMKSSMARYHFAVAGSNLGHWVTTGGAI